MNMILSPYKITGPYNTGDPIPALPVTSDPPVMNSPISSLTLNTNYFISKTFTPNQNHSHLWYFPWSRD